MRAAVERAQEMQQSDREVLQQEFSPPAPPEPRAMTAEELQGWDPGAAPQIGLNVGLFDYVKVSKDA